MPSCEHIIVIGSCDPKVQIPSKNALRVCFSLTTAMRVLQARGLSYAIAKDTLREVVKTKELVKVQSGFELIEIQDKTTEYRAYLDEDALNEVKKQWHGVPHHLDLRRL